MYFWIRGSFCITCHNASKVQARQKRRKTRTPGASTELLYKKKLRDAKHTEESHRRVGEVRPRCGMTKNQLCVKIKRLSAENQNASNAE